jgi:acyl-coenzyme A synthetase/AMP-(fatty) acid ligase
VLLEHPSVAQAAVVGIADDHLGQVVGAVIVLRAEAVTTAPELERFAAEQLSHFKVPRRWRFAASLPLTASGKVRKVELDAGFAPAPR